MPNALCVDSLAIYQNRVQTIQEVYIPMEAVVDCAVLWNITENTVQNEK